jgi:hypothetical protein
VRRFNEAHQNGQNEFNTADDVFYPPTFVDYLFEYQAYHITS